MIQPLPVLFHQHRHASPPPPPLHFHHFCRGYYAPATCSSTASSAVFTLTTPTNCVTTGGAYPTYTYEVQGYIQITLIFGLVECFCCVLVSLFFKYEVVVHCQYSLCNICLPTPSLLVPQKWTACANNYITKTEYTGDTYCGNLKTTGSSQVSLVCHGSIVNRV